MPAISIDDFALPTGARAAAKVSPDQMIKAAFDALGPWFAKIINTIETQWQRGVSAKDDPITTQIRLGKLTGQASRMGELLMQFVNEQLNVKPPLSVEKFKLPSAATTQGGLPAPEMIGKAFQALKPWFDSLVRIINPVYAKIASVSGATAIGTDIRLGGLEDQVNAMRTLLVVFVNQEIARKEQGQKFNALASGEEEAEISPELGLTILGEILDVEIGDNAPPTINEDVEVNLEDD